VTITTMILRYLDGSYVEGGKFYDDLSLDQRPSFGTDKGATAFFESLKSLTLVSILSTGYIAHYNAPKYYYELKDHTTGRFNVVVTVGFLSAAITYTVVSTMGFLTFGQNSMGFVLDNYSYRDPMATVARFGVAVSVIFAYPLLFHGGRDGLVSLLKTLSSTANAGSAIDSGTITRPVTQMESNTVTFLLLSTVTALAIYVNDLTFVLSFSGATMSSCIIYIFPPLMFSALVNNCCCYVNEGTDREVKLGYVMMVTGAILGIAGAYISVERALL
jgi:amino acid permease